MLKASLILLINKLETGRQRVLSIQINDFCVKHCKIYLNIRGFHKIN